MRLRIIHGSRSSLSYSSQLTLSRTISSGWPFARRGLRIFSTARVMFRSSYHRGYLHAELFPIPPDCLDACTNMLRLIHAKLGNPFANIFAAHRRGEGLVLELLPHACG